MARMARQLLMLALLAMPAASAVAQAPLLAPAAPVRPVVRYPQPRPAAAVQRNEEVMAPPPEAGEPQILRSLPRPPDQPGSLFEPAPPLGPPPPDLEHPYFERDPLTDPLDWPAPGWFTDVQVGVIQPHVSNPMMGAVTTGLGDTVVVGLGSARLDFTAAPRLEVGYRLPSGFGEFSFADRYFTAHGGDTIVRPNGPASRRSEFFLNYTDLDYASRELTPNVGWGLKFRGGLRAAQSFFGTRVDGPLTLSAAGNTVFAQRETNRDTSFGPHFGLDMERRLTRSGVSVTSNLDVAEMFTHVKQMFFAATTTPTAGLDSGTTVSHFIQEVPVLTAQLGLSWRPARYPNSRFYVGYFGQFWYKFATNSNVGVGPFGTPIETHFDNQGIVLQWSLNL